MPAAPRLWPRSLGIRCIDNALRSSFGRPFGDCRARKTHDVRETSSQRSRIREEKATAIEMS